MDRLTEMLRAWLASMTWDQWRLMVLALIAVYLVTDARPKVARWGPVFGLMSQPFWLYTSWTNAQGGVFVMSVVYVFMWCRGIKNGWWK